MQIYQHLDPPPSGGCDSRELEAQPCRSQTRVELAIHWVRQERVGYLGSNSGLRIPLPAPIGLQIEKPGQSAVRVHASSNADPAEPVVEALVALLVNGGRGQGWELNAAFRSWAAWCALPIGRRKEAKRLFPEVNSEEAHRGIHQSLEPLRELCRRILKATVPAMEKHYSALLAWRSTPEGAAPAGDRCVLPVTVLRLRLPMLDKKKWLDRVTALAACVVHVDEHGTIDVRPAGQTGYDRQLQTVLAVNSALNPIDHAPDAQFYLAFTDVRIVPKTRLMLCLDPILACYGGSTADALALVAAADGDDAEVSTTVSVSEEAAQAWFDVPRERTLDHYAAIGAVSLRIQECLRAWLSYVYFSKPEFFPDRDTAYSALVYCASRPHRQRSGPDFTYDPMSPASVAQASRQARKALPELLGPLRTALAASGRAEEASLFQTRLAPKMLRAARNRHKQFLKLLQADLLAVDRFTRFGNFLRALRPDSSGKTPRTGRDMLLDLDRVEKAFRIRFRRLDSREDLSALGPLLLVEASAALSAHYGRSHPVDLLVRYRPAGSSKHASEFVLRRRFLPSRLPLPSGDGVPAPALS